MSERAPGARGEGAATPTRRQRQLRLTVALGVVFVAGASIASWLLLARPERYRPGERVAGLTADLERALPEDHPRIVFTDVTREAGIDWRHFGATRTSQLPEDMGSGAAWGDFDGDGWEDLILVNTVGPLGMDAEARRRSRARTVLYRNDGDGTFTDVTARSGIAFDGWGMGAAWADYDADRDLDLLITAFGRNHLYRNEGNGTFSDRSAASGIGVPEGFWTGAAWGDYDRDGRLDVYVTGYVRYTTKLASDAPGLTDAENPASINPSSFEPERNLLFRNRGDGTFAEEAGRAGVAVTRGRGLVASWLDVDADGWPDLYVGNDVSDNVLYRNLGNGRFEDISLSSRIADYRSTMGIAVGDWNGDGAVDLYLTHWLAQGNALYDRVPGTMVFMDESDRFGLGQISLDFIGWGTSFFDYDNDGLLDLFVVNGSTLQHRDDPTRLVRMRQQLFWNRGPTEGFYEVSSVSGDFFEGTLVGRGLALADYDRDGDLDAVVTTNGEGAHLLRNDGGDRKRWIQVALRGAESNPQALGATLRLVAGGRAQVRVVGAQASYLSQNSLVEHFGLGDLQRADTLEITWPRGRREVRTDLAAGQRHELIEGAGGAGGTGGAVSAGSAGSGADRERIQRFWARMRAATALRTAGRTAEASAAYEEALALDPRHFDANYYAGNMRLALGDYRGAAAAWRNLVALDPSSARGHSQLGNLFLCLDAGAPFDVDSAESHFSRAHAINREETGTLLRLGEAALLRGSDAAATRHFETILATHRASAPARFYLGYIAWRRGDPVTAEREYARSLEAAPAVAPAGAPGEGDTKMGLTPLQNAPGRCDGLRALSEERGDITAMTARYRRLDSLLTIGRVRVGRSAGR